MRYLMMIAVFLLTGCNAISTLSSTDVPVSAIITAANGVDAAETVATAYIRYCTPNPSPSGCKDSAVQQIIKGVQAARIARNSAEQFLVDNPDAKLGPSTLVSAVTNAVSALRQIESDNAIKG